MPFGAGLSCVWGQLEAQEAHSGEGEGHACHLAAGGTFVEEQRGEQDGAGGIKRADHGGDVESAKLGSEDVEEIAEGVEHSREYADEPETLPGPGGPGNGDDNQKSRNAGDSVPM